MNVLGISCYYHDSAACLVRDGAIVSAAQEERFDRVKGSQAFPVSAVNACLQIADITANDVDLVAFHEKPFLKLERVLLNHTRSWPHSLRTFLRTMPPWLDDRLVVPLAVQRDLGIDAPVHFIPHHHSHAASAFYPSPFDEAAVLTADGVGEWATTTLGRGKGTQLQILSELHYPDSLGLLYSAVTTWLGFRAMRGEGKVMALAECGDPVFLDKLRDTVDIRPDGSFRVDPATWSMVEGDRMFGAGFVDRFGPPREPGSDITARERDMAASLQRLLEHILVRMARHLHAQTGLPRLVMAGGVCLNITATSRVLDDTPFTDIFIQPASGDSGGALGAALAISHAEGSLPRGPAMSSAALGPQYPLSHLRRALRVRGLEYQELDDDTLVDQVARRIHANRVVGWFQGRLEFGPRALGQRSILANPCHPDMKNILNRQVKHREDFRPYGVAVLLDRVSDFFDCQRPSPFMLQVARALPEQVDRIPAAIHVNQTSRLQTLTREDNGIFYRLVEAFGRVSGVPMVINTSFNGRDEPIACTPEDAIQCFEANGLDCLVLGNLLVDARTGDRS